ncbi:MAG: hypothetical protein R3Y08_01130 [Rikenellaceae bacterium]
MIVYTFRMLSDENDHFVRDYEVPSTLTLLELHEFIIDTLEYDQCMTSFFTADSKWEKIEEFTTVYMGFEPSSEENVPRSMDSVALCDILSHMHDRLIYNFDLFVSRAYYLELIDAKEVNDPHRYPRESFAHATPPDQYDPYDSEEDGSIFDEMMDDFCGFDGKDDNYEDEY